ncbi:transposase [Auricularia subglabra TFB-10046 SS5]|nr:transposase [Auricularia subglabra TFB-10046 SS5]
MSPKQSSDAKPEPRQHTSVLTGEMWVRELLAGHPARIYDNMAMRQHVFRRLSEWLAVRCDLTDTRWVTKEEQLAIFLYACVTNLSNRKLAERFQRSGDTISRIFHRVLDTMIQPGFYKALVMLPDDRIPPEIRNNEEFWPWFQFCIDAADGSHLECSPTEADYGRYLNRKGFKSINALAASNFDMRFVYILSGWEGSAADSTIFEDARATDFTIPPGRCYVADAGFPSCDELLVPYRGVRYHLREWQASGATPMTHEELFNLCHARLRNIIERIFGIMKKRYAVLREGSAWPVETEAALFPALCAIHNFICIHNLQDMGEDDDDEIETRLPDAPGAAAGELGGSVSAAEKRRANARRDDIAMAMWNDYVARGGGGGRRRA